MSKQLKTVIAQSATKPLSEQKFVIENSLDSWMNPLGAQRFEQIDDITLLCLEV
jgi:hypothetical protein